EIARLLLVPLANQVPRRDEDLLLTARDLVLLAAATTAAAATAAGLARLRETALERLNLDEVEVALRRPAAVLRDDVVRNQIARLEARLGRRRFSLRRPGSGLVELPAELRDAQILDVEHRARTAARIAPRTHGLAQLLEVQDLILHDRRAVLTELDGHRLPLAAVHRVAQLDVPEAEVVARLDAQRHFLDVVRTRVAARLRDLDDRLLVRNHVDEVVVGEPNVRLVEQRRNEVLARLVHGQRRRADRPVRLHR